MRQYQYEAKDLSTDKLVKAVVQAESESAAAKLLVAQGFMPKSIKELDESGSFIGRITGRITTKDKVVFTRQLSTLLGAGLPLSQSLRTVSAQTANKQLKNVVEDIITSVEGGRSLVDSFGKHPTVFNPLFLALVEAGEASGTLDDSLQRIAAQQEKDAAMISKIRGAMTYPAIVLAVILLVVAFMLFTIVPQIKNLYVDLNQTLPFITAALIAMADFAINFWWLIILTTIGIVFFGVQYFKTDQGIRVKDTIKLSAPLFGNMFRKLYMARFARTSQTLLKTGVPMLDTLRIAAEGVNNTIIAAAIDRAADKVKGGKALSKSLEKEEEHILPFVPQMISIGEQSGKIDEMLGKTAQVYEDELDEEIRALSTAIEPVLMVILAVVAGGLVGAILFPIYNLVNSIL